MTTYVEQSSASDRLEAAKRALAIYDRATPRYPADGQDAHALAKALRALITPPAVGESEEEIVERIVDEVGSMRAISDGKTQFSGLDANTRKIIRVAASIAAEQGVSAGIQLAHETWEPEVRYRPLQSEMLRWLGIEHEEQTTAGGREVVFIYQQDIEREEI